MGKEVTWKMTYRGLDGPLLENKQGRCGICGEPVDQNVGLCGFCEQRLAEEEEAELRDWESRQAAG